MAMSRLAIPVLVLQAISGVTAAPTPAEKGTTVLAAAAPPATFTANPTIGPGGSTYVDSPHFRVYGGGNTQNALNMLEAAYSCFVNTLGWRSSGLSYNDAAGTGSYTKVPVYSVTSLPGAAGVMHSDYASGISWLEVLQQYIADPGTTVHEFGHGLTYAQRSWVDQGRTGAWWETTANWVADTYKTSSLCASARSQFGQSATATGINLAKVIGDSFQVIVDGTAGSGNYYEAWPLLTYITANPDNYAGLGTNAMREMFNQYAARSNETPLHVLDRITTANTVQEVVGRYWARMAFADIGHPTAQSVFLSQRSRLNYANLDSAGTNVYRVKSARRPRYMGANIIPLKKSGAVTVNVQVTGATSAYTASLSVRNTGTGASRYVTLANGAGSTAVASNEEVTLVVANTPALILYDPFALSGSPANTGMDYSVTITGATV